jgi:hypothetical protein
MVGKSDCERTFARAFGNDEVAPIPVARGTEIERQGSILCSHSHRISAVSNPSKYNRSRYRGEVAVAEDRFKKIGRYSHHLTPVFFPILIYKHG